MLLSYIVYFGLLIECWIFSYFAEKRNRKLLIWVIILWYIGYSTHLISNNTAE